MKNQQVNDINYGYPKHKQIYFICGFLAIERAASSEGSIIFILYNLLIKFHYFCLCYARILHMLYQKGNIASRIRDTTRSIHTPIRKYLMCVWWFSLLRFTIIRLVQWISFWSLLSSCDSAVEFYLRRQWVFSKWEPAAAGREGNITQGRDAIGTPARVGELFPGFMASPA